MIKNIFTNVLNINATETINKGFLDLTYDERVNTYKEVLEKSKKQVAEIMKEITKDPKQIDARNVEYMKKIKNTFSRRDIEYYLSKNGEESSFEELYEKYNSEELYRRLLWMESILREGDLYEGEKRPESLRTQ